MVEDVTEVGGAEEELLVVKEEVGEELIDVEEVLLLATDELETEEDELLEEVEVVELLFRVLR